jgi:cytochrome P450
LAGHPARLGTAVEELLRFVPLQTAGVFARYALEDVEFGGVVVRAGDAVVVDLTSANRDATVFERPDELDLERAHNPHVAFGHGIHHCLGAALARMELAVGLETLAARLPGLALAVPPAEVPWLTGMVMRAPAALPARW